MRYLSKAEIIFINKRVVSEFGGSFLPPNNIIKNDNLEYLIEAVHAEMFDAAVYFYNIITGHFFSDGNKRTALEASLAFIELNGHKLKDDLNNFSIVTKDKVEFKNELLFKLFHFTNYFTSGLGDLDICIKWFQENIKQSAK